MTDKPRSLGELIREQRKLARLSLRELSRLTRVSNAYLSQVERGLHEPSLRVLNAVAEALDVPVESMVSPSGKAAASTSGDDIPGVEEAIRLDPALTEPDKQALLTIYRSIIQRSDPAASGGDEPFGDPPATPEGPSPAGELP